MVKKLDGVDDSSVLSEESIDVARDLLDSDPELGAAISTFRKGEDDTIRPSTLAGMLESNPLAAALALKLKDSKKSAIDAKQNESISVALAKSKENDDRLKSLERERNYWRGVIGAVGIFWIVVSWVVPLVVSKDTAKGAMCSQVNSCKANVELAKRVEKLERRVRGLRRHLIYLRRQRRAPTKRR